MNQYLIDDLIRDNGSKDSDGYHFFFDNLSRNEQINAIAELVLTDEAIADIVLNHVELTNYIQSQIDSRKDILYCEDQYSAGLKPFIDNQTGVPTWRV